MVIVLERKEAMITSVTDPMVTHRFRVLRTQRETHDTHTLELESVVGKDAFGFAPGQFNMLYAYGVGEIPISISGDPGDKKKLVHTVRGVGMVSNTLCKTKKGGIIGVRGPFGSGWPVEDAKGNDVFIVAGGIGLAPLRPAIYYLLAHRENYGKLVLLYGARSPAEILFLKELEQWRGRFDLIVDATVDTAPSGWRGNVGLVTTLIPKVKFDPYHTIALVCGPELMLRFTVLELYKHGIEHKNIFISMERNMKCGIGHCGHCQCGPFFVCKDGPVFSYEEIKGFSERREV